MRLALLAAPLTLWLATFHAHALDGAINIHDPSTVIQCDGKYYVFGTGRGLPFLVSSNGFDWDRGGHVFDRVPDSVKVYSPSNNGTDVWAPDIIHVNNQYCLYYAVSSWGSFISAVGLMTSPTLNPGSHDYKWTDRGMVVHSSEGQDLNAIDPGVCLAPDGTLWLCYGSYHGNIELVQLDPATGLRLATNSPVTIIANQSEASDIIHHGDWFYLFVNHGSCCQGTNSTYNIRVGRAKTITGPYLDRFGDDLVGGGGNLFLAAQGNDIGPGHFGLLLDDGVEKFSCHYEGVLGRTGRSILDIRPMLWTADDWPLPGQNLPAGTYQILCQRTGTIISAQTATNETYTSRPDAGVKMTRYLSRNNQKWTITPAGHGYYQINNLQTHETLSASSTKLQLTSSTAAPGDDQLWKIDGLTDGTYRLATRKDGSALTAALKPGSGPGVTLQKFDGDEAQRWLITAP